MSEGINYDTPYGPMRLTVINCWEVALDAYAPKGVDVREGLDRPITINGVEYVGRLNLNLRVNKFGDTTETEVEENYRQIDDHFHRVRAYSTPPTPAARAVIRDKIGGALRAWVKTHESEMLKGDVDAKDAELRAKLRKRDEVAASLAAIDSEITEARAALRDAMRAHSESIKPPAQIYEYEVETD